MTYQLPPEVPQEILDASDKKIAKNLAALRDYGPEKFDHPLSAFDRRTGPDFTGYTETWIKALEAEQIRRLEVKVSE